jgi:hypothetical protein
LVVVMIGAVIAASTLTISLNYFKTRRVLRTQEDLVYSFVANDLASTIEDGMNLGISLAMLQTTEQLIQRRRAAAGRVAAAGPRGVEMALGRDQCPAGRRADHQ